MLDAKMDKLVKDARRVPLPRDFHGGVSPEAISLPQSILVWQERTATHMNELA